MLNRLTQAGVVDQGGLDWQNRDHGQNVQGRPMVGRLGTNLLAIREASLAALSGFRVGLALALKEKARHVGIDDKNGINACKLLGLEFTTATRSQSSLRLRETGVTRIR